MDKLNTVDSNLVKLYVSTFPERYLTLRKLRLLSLRQREFHFDNHWNILTFDNDCIRLSYLNGGTGEIEKTLTSISTNEIEDVLFFPWEDNFILFKYFNGQLKGRYTPLTLGMLERITDKHIFFAKNGFKVKRKILNLTNNNIAFDEIEISTDNQ